MILKINGTSSFRANFVREVITFANSTPEAEVKIDMEDVRLSELQDLFYTTDLTSVVLYADGGDVLADYSEYGLDHLEQSIQDDIIITSIMLRNIVTSENNNLDE